jgi:hypothetical protein
MNFVPTFGALAATGGAIAVIGGFWYWATPKFFRVGYMPHQPAMETSYIKKLAADKSPLPGHDFPGFSHQIHAGKLGLDCRYCHTKVELAPEANIPNVATCYGCHAENHVQLPAEQDKRVGFIRDAYTADEPIHWRRVHKVPDYVRNFPHNIHVNAGVSCFSCHGQITGLPVVAQMEPLSMSWCLDCHRTVNAKPEQTLVPRDKVTNLLWVEDHFKTMEKNGAAAVPGFDAKKFAESLKLQPPTNCGACHY